VEDKQEGISRRNFLKVAGAGFIALLGYKLHEKFSNLETKPTFLEVNKGDPLPLKLSGKAELQYVGIDYHESDEKLFHHFLLRKEHQELEKLGKYLILHFIKLRKVVNYQINLLLVFILMQNLQ